MLKALQDLLETAQQLNQAILVPSVVINGQHVPGHVRQANKISELDGLTASQNPLTVLPSITVGDVARSATTWLLQVNKSRRETGRGVVRCQKWIEKDDTSVSLPRMYIEMTNDVSQLTKADDRILDCCLYFMQQSADVRLWTNDRNLSVLAETNGVPTIGGRGISFSGILAFVQPDLPNTTLEKALMMDRDITVTRQPVDENGMELDHDLVCLSESGHRNVG